MKNQVGVEEGESCVKRSDQHNSNKPTGSGVSSMAVASAELQTAHSNARINVCDFNLLHNYFLHMFETSEETNPVKEKAKKNKKSKKCSKSKDKRAIEPLSAMQQTSVPEIKINRNASWFAMFASVRKTCLEHQSRAATFLQVAAAAAWQDGSETDNDLSDSDQSARSSLPKVVNIGLRAVFDMIKETETSHPLICQRGLRSLLDVLQGLQPEDLKDEPEAIMESMFSTLLELASRSGSPVSINGNVEPGAHIRALACSCLLSLSVASGSTAHLLRTTTAVLMSPRSYAGEVVVMPGILASLQRSVHSLLIKRAIHPDYMSHGVPVSCLVDSFPVAWKDGNIKEIAQMNFYSLASDGHYLYLHSSVGLYKIGSGYSGTMKGHVYRHKPDFYPDCPGWLGIAGGVLYFKLGSNLSRFELVVVDRDSLECQRSVQFSDRWPPPHLMLTDEKSIGLVTPGKDDTFTIKFLSPHSNPMTTIGDLPIKLARKCVQLMGSSVIDDGSGQAEGERYHVEFGVDDEVQCVASGKEFSLMLTNAGKLYFTGKSVAIGHKQPCSPGRWNEVIVSKSGTSPVNIVQFSVGHDGLHALLVSEDGTVYFTGTSKRGEDADHQSKPRRQPKPSKPKKLSRMEGQFVVTTACNSGTSCMVNKKGELFVFGKDSSHADFSTGQVTELSGHVITQVAAGKAHIVVLTNNYEVFTFGMNNKGQCGRDFPVPAAAGQPVADPDCDGDDDHEADTEAEIVAAAQSDLMCPPGKHKWKHDQCMICTVCGECTGYGAGCVSASRPDRNPGMFCGCGNGDSGCGTCGACRVCCGELGPEMEPVAQDGVPVRDLIRLDLIGGAGQQQQGEREAGGGRSYRDHRDKFMKRRLAKMSKESRRSRKYAEPMGGRERSNIAPRQEQEPDKDVGGKLTSLGPGRVPLHNNIKISSISCGLHHTLLLTSSGQVLAFGSNTHGQLGVGDLVPRGAPTQVLVITEKVSRVAAGSYHSVALTTSGKIYTWGYNGKFQLGRRGPACHEAEIELWYAFPGHITGLGAAHGKTVTWIGASADQTILKLDESLINAQNLVGATICANKHQVLLLPTHNKQPISFHSLCISRSDGFCRSFSGLDQVEWSGRVAALDPLYDVLWSVCGDTGTVQCHNPTTNDIELEGKQNIMTADLALPVSPGCLVSRSQAALNLLSCLDTITSVSPLNSLSHSDEDSARLGSSKAYSKEDFSIVNRFDSHGGGWGYSGHSIEAVRFTVDTDILMGGFGLFGGRGEYVGKIKLFDIGADGGENEGDGELLCESEEITYECGARQKYPIMFEEPVQIVAGKWYVAWARVSGPSSDCGSSGQGQVTTEEQIMFTFKSSKKSNNGTDVNAGQIPQLLYRIVAPESSVSGRKYEPPEPVHILSSKFGRPLTTDSFQALLALLQWAWSTFKLSVAEVVDAPSNRAALMDLQRLVFICKANLRLIVSYIEDIYPSPSSNTDKDLSPSLKSVPETQRLAECVYEVRSQLVSMLADCLPALTSIRNIGQPANLKHEALEMAESLMKDAHGTFVSCFHAFYPTGPLKWVALCSLLSNLDSLNCDRLLAAVIDSLCNPIIKLRSTFPIAHCDNSTDKSVTGSPVENVSANGSMVQLGEMSSSGARYPILSEVMNYHSQSETVKFSLWNFSDVLTRLLVIVSQPIHEALSNEKVSFSRELVSKTCRLIACVVSELSSLKGGTEGAMASIDTKVSLLSPNRFTRTSNSRTWNTGNGSPDAICFTVDRSGVMVAGAGVYGGVGSFDYELELLHDQSAGEKDSTQGQRWVSLVICHGTYSSDDCNNDIAVIKFDKPVTIVPHTKYALRLRNHGARTNNGDGGQSTVRGTDGTTFTFTSCSLSFNGTNVTRGQVPQILYYSSPADSDQEPTITNSTANLAQTFSRQSALHITVSVVRHVSGLLMKARQIPDGRGQEVLNSASVITSLLPHIMASVACMASTDPVAAVKVLSLVQDLLPSVSELNNEAHKSLASSESDLPSPHYAWVESEHPYKPAGVWNYKVMFPTSVRWMSVEFDTRCCTGQQEDSLQLYIRNPADQRPRNVQCPLVTSQNSDIIKSQKYSPVLTKFSGKTNWPSHGVVLPGNEILFSLETASDYVKGESKDPNFGFKCLVTGYECNDGGEDGLKNLEHELAYLGGLCASSLMSKAIQLPSIVGSDDKKEDFSSHQEYLAQELFDKYPTLLKKGFAIEHLPNVHQALAGYIPFSCQSYERLFLKDFVQCSPGTAGGRLAAWLQPESYISTENCGVIFRPEDLRCSWPAIITVVTRDQYGASAHVPNMKVEVKAIPIDELNTSINNAQGQSKVRTRLTQPDSMTFGGHPPPNLDTKYEVTVKDKMFYHAITVNKAYDNYSFEELRYASPKLQRQSENMLVRPNGDGTYSANWTPGNVGWYKLMVLLDGCELPTAHKVEVMDPPQGKPPPSQNKKTCPSGEVNRLRQFIAKPSAGLRVRLHPTLQSEQIGVVPVDGTLHIIDELSNSDGVWVRLSQESLSEHCTPNYTEGWCLQYNQHFDKMLLKPIAEPLPSVKPKDSSFQKPPPSNTVSTNLFPSDQKAKKRSSSVKRGPGNYTVVKCGASGHNVRCAPSMYAAPIGQMSLGDNILVHDVRNLGSGECWVKLEKQSAEKFAFGDNVDGGECWSLAVAASGTQFIESEYEIQADLNNLKWTEASPSPAPAPSNFMTPPFGVNNDQSSGWGAAASAQPQSSFFSPVSAMSSDSSILSPRSLDSSLSRRKSLPRPVRPSTPPRQSLSGAVSGLGAVNKTPNPNSPTFGRGRAGSVERKSFFQKWFKGDEGSRRSSSSPVHSRKSSPADPQRKSMSYNKDIPPELQGVSVKELVKVIGASRANGNGVTPPGTPGTPRKSRSCSPAPAALGSLAFNRSRSSSPISIGHGRAMSPKSHPSISTSGASAGDHPPGLTRQNSAQSDTSALVSSLTRDMSGLSASPASIGRLDGSLSPVSLKSESRMSSPRIKDPLSQPVFQMSTTSMEISRDSLKEVSEPPLLTSAPPPVVQVKPKPPEKPMIQPPTNSNKRSHIEVNNGPVVEAMSPSVAESIRAVFAAFIWHAGVVQDGMACASFLKHNTGLTKRGSGVGAKKIGQEARSAKENKAKQRHSVEVISSAYLNYKEIEMMEKSMVNANTNRNVTKYLADIAHDAIPEDSVAHEEEKDDDEIVPGLPLTLGQLVILWEGIVLSCLDNILEQTSANNTWNKERNKGNVSNKSKNQGNNSVQANIWTVNNKDQDKILATNEGNRLMQGNNIAPGAGAGGIYQMCDICGGYFEHPVTYHMKMSHPGCGGHAGGRGYNSGGQYCGGWAGNCGDGGIGGSSWYLICEVCKEKHSKGYQKSNKAKSGGDNKQNLKQQMVMPITSMMASIASSPVGQMDCHMVMKANSLFLLNLASSSDEETGRKRSEKLPTVSELIPGDPGAFPYTQFHCLEALGVQDHQLKELNDELMLEENWRRGNYPDSRCSAESMRQSDVDRDKPDANPDSDLPTPPSEFLGSMTEPGGAGAVLRRNKFHRSVSIGSPKGKDWSSPTPSGNRILTNRKRNSSHEAMSSEHHQISTAEFLSHTSPAWKKLFEGGNVSTKLIDSPVLSFLLQWNDLDSLQVAMTQSLRKAVCRSYSMQAFTWLLRSVSQPVCLHDLLWFLISSWQLQPAYKEANKNCKKDKDEVNAALKEENDLKVSHKEREEGFEHPMSDLSLIGGAEQVLQSSLHTLLQTISDLMRLLPLGSALQQAAITCFSLKFWPTDHPFLHQSHLFSTISKILSRGDGDLEDHGGSPKHIIGVVASHHSESGVERWTDMTNQVELSVSSRQAMVPSLTDASTETFWESGDEDRNKTKWISLKIGNNQQARSVAVHIDNGRDIGNKVSSLTFKTGKTQDDMLVLKTVEVENRFAGWVTCFVNEGNCDFVRIELKGPDNTVRLRQVKVIGKSHDVLSPNPPEKAESQKIQQSNCETETLRVFRLITRQVFGKLLESDSDLDIPWDSAASGTDLKEHVVGILFSRSKLSHLQKQVCCHIVAAISKEAACFREEWELSLCSQEEDVPKVSDSYCYEMLSMVMALSGSNVGRIYLSQQYPLLKDLLSLLHTGSARVQRAVISVLRRVLPLVPPVRFANLLSVQTLPPKDFTILTAASLSKSDESNNFDSLVPCILDIFLSCISKALTMQVKKKSGNGKSMSTVSLATCIHPRDEVGTRWWLRGSMSKKIAEEIILMLKDMMAGKMTDDWSYIAKSAVAESVLNLTRLGADQRSPEDGIKCTTIWLAVASLCVLDKDHVEGLSSGEWGGAGGQEAGNSQPTCDNHDDGETLAVILCDTCGNLCADCDRFLHLHRKTRHHARQVFKEEEEAIKVNLHEGCGRTKLFWLTAAADSSTLKGMIEFREDSSRKKSTATSTVTCKYCGGSSCAALPVLDGVCTQEECQEYQLNSCSKINPCGHACGGIANEDTCLPCLQGCDKSAKLKQDADDMCMICFTDPLSPIPSILLQCGHVFHYHCVKAVLQAKWHGPRISFGFTKCPICKVQISHPALQSLMGPIISLYEDVKKKALMRLEYEGLSKCEAVVSEGARWFNDPAGFAMDRYAYYVCFKCGKAYFGGEARCDLDAGAGDTFNPEELVCGGCSDVSQAQMCPKHGTDYLEYKCRYCCSVAVFFCFGTTHFCNACHDDFQRVANIPKTELPQCPVAPKAVPLDLEECPLHVKHPPTGEEFALGCGVCRNAHTF